MSDDELLTISDVVARFRDAGIGSGDQSRRTYIHELMRRTPPALEDFLDLAEGRQRAGKHDRRITAESVEAFLGGLKPRHRDAVPTPNEDGRTALQEALARVAQLLDEKETERTRVANLRRKDAEQLAQQDLQIADLKDKLRLREIDLDTLTAAHSDERGTRMSHENILAQLLSPDDASTILT